MSDITERSLNKGYWKNRPDLHSKGPVYFHSKECEKNGIFHLLAGFEMCTCEIRCPAFKHISDPDA